MALSTETPPIDLDDIRAAAARLDGVALRTPLVPLGPPHPGDPLGRPRLWLKAENLQAVGAFKIRGAYNALATLPPERRAAGVVTHSSGNHAQGVARAARLLGMRAVIVMPSDAPAVKVARVRADGAEIVVVGTSSSERASRARELSDEQGLALVPSYDDVAVMAGQGTVGLEIVEQVEALESRGDGRGHDGDGLTVLVPIGGGGLASGVATAVKGLRPRARVLGVEPVLAADARESLERGRIVTWDAVAVARTSADGMRTQALGELPFRQLRRYLDGVVTVSEEAIARAMVRAATGARLVVEPSGATAIAAALFPSDESRTGGWVVAVVSGGNVDPERYAALVAAGRAAGG